MAGILEHPRLPLGSPLIASAPALGILDRLWAPPGDFQWPHFAGQWTCRIRSLPPILRTTSEPWPSLAPAWPCFRCPSKPLPCFLLFLCGNTAKSLLVSDELQAKRPFLAAQRNNRPPAYRGRSPGVASFRSRCRREKARHSLAARQAAFLKPATRGRSPARGVSASRPIKCP